MAGLEVDTFLYTSLGKRTAESEGLSAWLDEHVDYGLALTLGVLSSDFNAHS